jgi:hypothetical protein
MKSLKLILITVVFKVFHTQPMISLLRMHLLALVRWLRVSFFNVLCW